MPQKLGGLADRAAGVGAGCAECGARRDRCRRAARGAAGNQRPVVPGAPPRVLDRAVMAGRVGRPHRELVEIGFPEHDRAGLPQLLGNRRFVGRRETVEDVRGGGGRHVPGTEQILDRDRDAVERPALAAAEPRVGGSGHVERPLRGLGNERVERPRRLDRRDMGFGQLARRERLRAQPGPRLGQGEVGQCEVGQSRHPTTFTR